jgi:hypothetical protein
LWVRILPRALTSVPCACCVLSGRGRCVGPIPRPEESYRVWCVWVWSWSLHNEEVVAHLGLSRHGNKLSPLERTVIPNPSGFKFQTAALQVLHVTFQA